MLDLNTIDCDDSSSLVQFKSTEEVEQHPPSQTQTDSATSSSSIIVNATSASDEDSTSIHFTNTNTRPLHSTLFFHDILSTDHHQIPPPLESNNSLVVPLPQWLNLSSSSELWSLQHQSVKHQLNPVAKKSRRGTKSRSSPYRGVTFYRRTGRWESHIWDCGKQVYLGGFDTAHTAARAYDRAAIKFRGVEADINFNLKDYDQDMKRMSELSKEEFVHVLRRQSTGFARSSSKYRGVILQKYGRPEAVINVDTRNYGRFNQTSATDGTLDLSLSVTPTSKSDCQVTSGLIPISGFSGYTKFGGQRDMLDSSASPVIYGQPPHSFTELSPPGWQFARSSGSGHLSSNKNLTMERRMVVTGNPLPGHHDWAVQVPQGHHAGTLTASMQFLPIAASSGFSSCLMPMAPPTHTAAPPPARLPTTNALYYNFKD